MTDMTTEQKLRDLQDYLYQLQRQKFNEDCQALINTAQTTAEKIAILDQFRKDLQSQATAGGSKNYV